MRPPNSLDRGVSPAHLRAYRRWRTIGLVIVAVFLALISDTAFPEEPDDALIRRGLPDQPGPGSAPSFVPGEVLVMFKPGTAQSQIDSLIAEYGATVLSIIAGLNVYHMKVAENAVEAALEGYRRSPYVQGAQRNFISAPAVVPNDTFYDDGQLVFSTADQNDFQRWYLGPSLLNAEGAWDLTTGRSDVVIAIIDSGIKLAHPDLAANIWVNPGEVAGDGIDNDGNGKVDDINGWDFNSVAGGQDNNPNPDLGDGLDNDGNGAADDNVSHGTEVAGAAGAVGNNSLGVAGAAWNVKLMALKVFRDDGGAPDSAVLAAIDYAISKRAHVINLSLGSDNVHCPTSDPLFEAAITSAFNAGVLVVVAAGNDNTNRPGSPDSCTHALAVGGSDHNSTDFLAVSGLPKDPRGRAFFSNFSPFVSVVAPAVSLASTSVSSQADENAGGFLKGTHLTLVGAFGTSFSAPLVSGLAALIISRGKDLGLNLTPTQVRALIENHAVDLPDDSNDSPDAGATWDGKGRVNFRASVSAITTVTTCTPPASGNWVVAESCTFVGSATAPANVIVDVEVALTIAGGASLDINFSTNHLRIKNGAKVVIKSGGKIR